MCILFYRSYSLPPPSSLRFVYFFGERLYHFFCRAISVGMFCCFRASSIRWPGEKGAQQQQEEVWRMARGACIVAFSSWRWQKKRNAERTWPPVNGAMCPVSTHAGCGTARKPHDAVQRLSSDNELLTLKTLRVHPPPLRHPSGSKAWGGDGRGCVYSNGRATVCIVKALNEKK